MADVANTPAAGGGAAAAGAADDAAAAGAAAEAVSIPDHENVDLLLETHREAIAELKSLCPEVREQPEWPFFDDLFFLRFMLSFKTPEKAAANIKKCVEWRAANEDLLSKAPKNIWTDEALQGPFGHIFKEMAKYQVASAWDPSSINDGGFIVVIRGAMGSPKLLYTHLTNEEMTQMNFVFREMAYKHCDTVTRQTRRLAKQTLLFDTQGMSFSDMLDPKQQKVMGHVSKVSAFVYPQLIRKMCMLNAPKWMSVVLKIAKAFLSKNVTEKIDVFSSEAKFYRSEFATQMINADKLPAFLGGQVPDESLPAQLTGEMCVSADEQYEDLHVMARSFIETKFGIPCAGSTVELRAYLEHFGINYVVRASSSVRACVRAVLMPIHCR